MVRLVTPFVLIAVVAVCVRALGDVRWLLIVIGVVIAVGFVLWWPRHREEGDRAALGASLVTGAAISLAFFALQDQNQRNQTNAAHLLATREKQIADQQAAAQRAVSEEQALRLTVGLQHDLAGVDLAGRDLRGFDLARKDLSHADLHGAKLGGASLADAMLDGANLEGARMVHANLIGASLREANLRGAILSYAHLDRAHLEDAAAGSGASFRHAVLNDAHLEGACLAQGDLRGAVLAGADLSNAVLTGVDLRGAELQLEGIRTDLHDTWLAHVRDDAGTRPFLQRAADTRPRAELSSNPPRGSVGATPDRVEKVYDGDTIELNRRGWVRLMGLNAPNPNDPAGGQAATTFVQKELKRGSAVRYTLAPQKREDKPGNVGRWQGYVWLRDGTLLNEAILNGGYARRQRANEDPRYAPLLNDAERRAKAAGLGVWATCASPD